MNLPHSAIEFFPDAISRLNVRGTIHLYTICERNDIGGLLDDLVERSVHHRYQINIDRCEELKTYSPTMSVFSVDVLLVNRV